jgi:ADP-heptose:LPS heptosyltransferase
VPRLREAGIGAGAWLLGLPWRLKPGRGKPLSPEDPRLERVLVLKPCCMGDLLMATPAIAALRKTLPTSHIALAVGDYSRPAVANNPRIDELISVEPGSNFGSYRQMARKLQEGKYGTAVVLDRSPLLNLVPRMARVGVRAGLDSGNRGIALTHPVPCPPVVARHEVEWYLDVVRALGIEAPSDRAFVEFHPTEAERQGAGRVLSELSEESETGVVAIHLGGGSNPGMKLPSKRWHPERWARVADWLAETYEPAIILLGGPGKEDREAAAQMLSAVHPSTRGYVTDLVGKLDWGTAAAVLERCALFLGHDTGAMHLATAVCTPVVAIFGPSDPARYGPWDLSGRSIALSPDKVSSNAESLRAASLSGEPYNTAIPVEQVWSAVERVYGRELGSQ